MQEIASYKLIIISYACREVSCPWAQRALSESIALADPSVCLQASVQTAVGNRNIRTRLNLGIISVIILNAIVLIAAVLVIVLLIRAFPKSCTDIVNHDYCPRLYSPLWGSLDGTMSSCSSSAKHCIYKILEATSQSLPVAEWCGRSAGKIVPIYETSQ